MRILIPKTITSSMLAAGTTVAEPAPDETAWVSGGTYAVGDMRIRATTHRTYMCTAAHTGHTTPPEADTAYWSDEDPTQRMAPFDTYVSTPATGTGSLTYVISASFFNALALYGLVGTLLTIVIKASAGGAVIYSRTIGLTESAGGWYEYFFRPPKSINKLYLSSLPIRPDAEITIIVSAGSTAPVAVGMIVLGDEQSLVGDLAAYGGTKYGASAEPMTYSYIDTNAYGKTRIVRRHSATGLRGTILLPSGNADAAVDIIQSVLDVPIACIAVDAAGYAGLNAFGLLSAKVSYDSFSDANIDVNVKGMI
jgi:hypothetical protein